ncbi:MAG: hypothetical protein CMF61_02810 [Magnetococcales bacterium]|nr:hypothetical protein [Magnetococcales bacterium]PPR19347.1 MAG: hypothetical protein CFH43_00238 [Pseudomonadota bacterium]|tara:strand:- start:2018 stop:2404 length:387 start_codon:yes stop_codon:yes gene_type:complete
MKLNLKKTVTLSLMAGVVLQTAACGTILHPERKGQIDGQIDTSIAALNAVGLLFFLVPGVIAFAVDFNNGTIYLPGGPLSLEGDLTNENIEAAILKHTGKAVNLEDESVQKVKGGMDVSAISSHVKYL